MTEPSAGHAAPMTLEQALRFDAADLQANRGGRLSPRQTQALRTAWRRTLALHAGLLLAITLGATIALFLGWRTESPVLTIVGIALTVCNAFVLGLLAQAAMRFRGDTSGTPVRVLEGQAERTLRVNPRARSAAYFVRLGGGEIRVNKPVFNAFAEGGRYRVYRAPASGQVLSAEHT